MMRRSPMPRRLSPVQPGVPLRRSRLKPRSKSRAAFYAQVRIPLVKRMLLAYPVCQFPGGCEERSVDVHELRKRGQGGSLSDPDNLRTSCRFHNEYAESEPRLCAELGWVRRASA